MANMCVNNSGIGQIFGRLEHQFDRTEGGDMSEHQEAGIERADGRVFGNMVSDLRQDDGSGLTSCQDRQLNRQLNRISGRIYDYNHPCQPQPDPCQPQPEPMIPA